MSLHLPMHKCGICSMEATYANNGHRLVCVLILLLHILSDQSCPCMNRKLIYCTLWRCLLCNNNYFSEREMWPWTNPPKVCMWVMSSLFIVRWPCDFSTFFCVSVAMHVCDVRVTCQTNCTIMRHSLHKSTTITKWIIPIHSETTVRGAKEANVAISES